MRYHREPAGCGDTFRLQHGLDSAKGGLIKKGQNVVRDNDARLAEQAWGSVTIEPILAPENDRTGHASFQADWSVRGVWEGKRVALFNSRIIDGGARSYIPSNTSCEAMANRAAPQREKYQYIIEELRGWITPLVCSTDGVLYCQYVVYQRRLAH